MRTLLAGLLITCILAPTRAATSEPPPVETFFGRAKLQSAQISPSGQWLAITAGAGTGRLVLAIVDTEGKQAPQVTASFSNADITSFQWVIDDRLVFEVADLLVGPGEERFGGLYSIKRDGTQQRQLFGAGRYHGEALLAVPRGGSDFVARRRRPVQSQRRARFGRCLPRQRRRWPTPAAFSGSPGTCEGMAFQSCR